MTINRKESLNKRKLKLESNIYKLDKIYRDGIGTISAMEGSLSNEDYHDYIIALDTIVIELVELEEDLSRLNKKILKLEEKEIK